ncbi:hypothetical protein ACFOGJ_16005 [Marinibaculum pumilum]|uniref:ArsR family transcriptional regulator n=1 Tax=Marinibaculum pumilum TaxID=1766165 RepID=A0ABV7L2W1_9PROT
MPTDDVKLTRARRAVLMGLYEGRELARSSGGFWWRDDMQNGWVQSNTVSWLSRHGWLTVRTGFPLTAALTPSGRALAERLAKEGR